MLHPFRESIRLKLLALLIQSKPKPRVVMDPATGLPVIDPKTGKKKEASGENLKLQRYLRSGWVLGFFPLHNREVTTELGIEWLRYNAMPWEQPLFAIKVIY